METIMENDTAVMETEAQQQQEHPSVAQVRANYDKFVDWTPVTVNFKTDKQTGIKRPSFEIKIPVPSVEGIIQILEKGGKVLELLQESMTNTVYTQLRAQINEILTRNREGDITPSMIDVSKLTWDYIASLSKAEKAVSAITKETWDAFQEDYIQVISRVTGRDLEKVTQAAKLIATNFRSVRGKKKVLQFLQSQLDIWFSNTSQEKQEEFADLYERLAQKVAELLQEDEDELLENLGV